VPWAEVAVPIEPVSSPNSLLTGEIYREFFKFGPFSAIPDTKRPANSMPWSKIPYALEQGIIYAKQGTLTPE
jgi:hypothetical protein